ncbi:restriction endonuclease subunit S, partial [Burkholderia gladioli]
VSDWPTVQLGKALELAYGKSLPKAQREEHGEIPVYGSNGIAGWHSEALVNEPTVIVGRKGSAGAVQYVDGPCFPIDTTYFVRVREGFSYSAKFLYYLLRRLNLSRLKTATGVPGLTRDDAYRETIVAPDDDQQAEVVDLLSRAESIVRLRTDAQRLVGELLHSTFARTFGDPATNPMDWPMTTVGGLITAADYGCSEKATSEPIGLPMIRMGNVSYAGALALDDLKYVTMSDEDAVRFGLVEGDILFNRTNSKDLVGKTGLWDGSIDAVVASYFIRLRVDRSKAIPTYLWAFMNSPHMKQMLFSTARGAIGQANINSKELKAFPIPRPPLDLQKTFDERCKALSDLAAQQQMALKKAEEAFESLLANCIPL